MFRSSFLYNIRAGVRNNHTLNRGDKQCMNTTSENKYLLKNYVKFIRLNIDRTGILQPTAEEIIKDIDLSDKTCLITGANSGIGLQMTRCLSNNDCTVSMACRNTYAADVVTRSVCGKPERIKVHEINLASLTSVKKCSKEILKTVPKLDIVILNAGVFGLPWTLTEDSFETTFQVNYLSHFYLLLSIEKILAPDARVVFTSSESHRHVNWSYTHTLTPTKEMVSLPEHEYTSIRAYNVSKLCSILFMHYLSYRWMNTAKQVFCAHPGSFVKTGLCRNWWPYEALYTFMLPFSKTIGQAASTPIYCATSPDLNGITDQYYKDLCQCDESELAKDLQLAFRLNDLTQELLSERAVTKDFAEFEEKKTETYPQQQKETVNDSEFEPNYSS